jgi:hypothetical protein
MQLLLIWNQKMMKILKKYQLLMKKLPSKLARGSLKLIKLFYLIRARRKIKALQDEKQEEEKEKERILEF